VKLRFTVGCSATSGDDDDGGDGGDGGGFGEVDDGHNDLRIHIFWNLMLCRWMCDSDISKDGFEMSMQGNIPGNLILRNKAVRSSNLSVFSVSYKSIGGLNTVI